MVLCKERDICKCNDDTTIIKSTYGHVEEIPSCICRFKNLKEIDLSSNEIRTVSKEIQRLDTLEKINLESNLVTDIPFFNKSLKKLYLYNNHIHKITNLDHLEKLETLEIGNEITRIENLDGLINLKNLGIKGYRGDFFEELSTIEGLDNLKNLERLHIENLDAHVIKGLDNQKKLKKMQLNGNISKMTNLNHLKDLETLRVFGKVTRIDDISNLVKLKELYITANKLENPDLSNLKNLEEIGFYTNKRIDWNESVPRIDLRNFKKLKQLYKSNILITNYLFFANREYAGRGSKKKREREKKYDTFHEINNLSPSWFTEIKSDDLIEFNQ